MGLLSMKNALHAVNTYFKRYMAFKKVDMHLVHTKLDRFSKPSLIHSRKVQLPSILLMNK
jgi:hypothetical protein